MNEKSKASKPAQSQNAPIPSEKDLPDANVDAVDQCILTETAEQTRPDSGEPCWDGRGAK